MLSSVFGHFAGKALLEVHQAVSRHQLVGQKDDLGFVEGACGVHGEVRHGPVTPPGCCGRG